MKEKLVKSTKYGQLEKKHYQSAITLIALVVTIVVLLILAGVSITLLWGENGIFRQAEEGGLQYKIASAREKLDATLSNAQMQKRINPKYNKTTFLDAFILEHTPNTKLLGDIVVTDGYAFNLDRETPKVGDYVGKESELVFPDLQLNKQVAEDNRSATITITTIEKTNGISKIEIIQNGQVIKTYEDYNNKKEQIQEEYVTKQNGTYFVKVYSNLTVTEKIEVSGLVAAVVYTPNKGEEYRKSYSVKVEVPENGDEVKNIKYKWLQQVDEPEDTSIFTETVTNGGTIEENTLTGTWYLWTLLETESGKTNIGRSEGFNFDNQGPTVNTLTPNPETITSFTLTATAQDNETKIAKYDFYVNGNLEKTVPIEEGQNDQTATCTIEGNTLKNVACYVIATDILGNPSQQKTTTASTKLHTWECWSSNRTPIYADRVTGSGTRNFATATEAGKERVLDPCSIDQETGLYTGSAGYQLHASYQSPMWHLGSCISDDKKTRRKYTKVVQSSFPAKCEYEDYQIYTKGYEYTKGNTQKPDVTGVKENDYPDKKGNITGYYIYKGIY